MCEGVKRRKDDEDSNYLMEKAFGFKGIHHVDLSNTMFSRVYW